jgi:hypothetical protein
VYILNIVIFTRVTLLIIRSHLALQSPKHRSRFEGVSKSNEEGICNDQGVSTKIEIANCINLEPEHICKMVSNECHGEQTQRKRSKHNANRAT